MKTIKPDNHVLDRISEHIIRGESLLEKKGVYFDFYETFPGDAYMEWNEADKRILVFASSERNKKIRLREAPVEIRLLYYPFLRIFLSKVLDKMESVLEISKKDVIMTDIFFENHEEVFCQSFNK